MLYNATNEEEDSSRMLIEMTEDRRKTNHNLIN